MYIQLPCSPLVKLEKIASRILYKKMYRALCTVASDKERRRVSVTYIQSAQCTNLNSEFRNCLTYYIIYEEGFYGINNRTYD